MGMGKWLGCDVRNWDLLLAQKASKTRFHSSTSEFRGRKADIGKIGACRIPRFLAVVVRRLLAQPPILIMLRCEYEAKDIIELQLRIGSVPKV